AVIGAHFLIQNAAALLFPAWVPLGWQRPRGLDMMGQRLILLGATLLTVAMMLVPAAIAGGAVWLALYRLAGAAALVVASAVGTVVVAIEVLMATEALGPAYERLDV